MGQTSNGRCIADMLREKKPTTLASANIRRVESEKHINTGWSFSNMDWAFNVRTGKATCNVITENKDYLQVLCTTAVLHVTVYTYSILML